jgi:HPt (histidine-containing phosphotransfer) domain-containing protein
LILSCFLESYEEQLAAIETTELPVEDPVTVRRTVHSLKGLLLDAGAQAAAILAAALEDKIVRDPQAVRREEIFKLAEATREAAGIIKEVADALPSLEVYSALPALEQGHSPLPSLGDDVPFH